MWSGANTMITRLISILMTAVVIRLVTPEEFGVFAVALTVFTVISGFSELGLSTCLARKDLDPDRLGPTANALALLAGALLAGLMALAAHPIAVALGAPGAAAPLRVLSLCVLMTGAFTVPVGLLTREFRQDSFFVATVVSFVPSNVLLVFYALHGDGALAFAWSRVVGQLFMGLVLAAYAGRSYWPRISRAELRVVAGIGLPVAGANLVRYILLNADYLFVGKLLGPVALGIYMLAFNIGSWATSVLSGIINSVAMPAMSQDNRDPRRFRESVRWSLTLISLAAFPIAGLSVALAPQIIRVLYGERWDRAAPVLMILGPYGALFALTILLGTVLIAAGVAGRLFVLQCLWLAGLVPAMYAGVELAGLRGAAMAHIVVIVALVIPTHLALVNRFLPRASGLLLGSTGRPVLLALAASAAAWGAAHLVPGTLVQLLVGTTVGLLVYVALALPLLRPFLPAGLTARLARVFTTYDATLGRVLNRLARAEPAPGSKHLGGGGSAPDGMPIGVRARGRHQRVRGWSAE